jgi:hypothetical protein
MTDTKFFIYTADNASPKAIRGKLLARVHHGDDVRHVLLDESLPLREALEKARQDAIDGVPLPEDVPEGEADES